MRISALIFFCGVLAMSTWPMPKALAQSEQECWIPNGRQMTQEEYHRYLDCVGDKLKSLWKREIRESILSQGISQKNLDELNFSLSKDCRWLPYYDPSSSPPTIVYNRRFLHFSSYLQQALLMYLLDIDTLGETSTFARYIKQTMAPILRSRLADCRPGANQQLPGIPSYINELTGDPNQYQREMAERTHARSKRLSDFVAAYPIFFSFLHEAGHHFTKSEHDVSGQPAELAADQFAHSVFSSQKIPVTFAITYMHLLFAVATEDPVRRAAMSKRDIACRIAILAEKDSANVKSLGPLGRDYVEQAEKLRQWYLSTFGKHCNPAQ